MEEFRMGIFKCNFLSLQLSYTDLTHISTFGLLFSTEKSDSLATHLTAVYILFPAQNQFLLLLLISILTLLSYVSFPVVLPCLLFSTLSFLMLTIS